ncbi:hypothetical protein Tco_1449802 [Tanacetum coccineum]
MVLSWYDLSATCHSKDSGPLQGLYLCRIVLSLAEASKLDLSFGWSEGDYTSSCPPSLVSAKLALKTHIVFGAIIFASYCCLLCSGFFPFLDDLNDLIIKYKIPHDLHPRLPLEEFVMSELPDDAIGIYHRMFDFSGVRIPFCLFLLALIKHYRVYFSQLCPLGLNKVITFEVLCRSLQIEPTVALFRVFQTLCKQGDWFSFAKRRDPSPAIPDAMVWRHPDAAIDDSRPATGYFSVADSRVCDPVLWGADGNVMGIHDFFFLPKWTSAEVQKEPHLDVSRTFQRLPFYCTPPAAADAVISDPTLENLAVGTPSSKILAKTEFTRVNRPLYFLCLPMRACLETTGGCSLLSASEGSNSRDSRGKGIMADDVAAPSVGASRPRPSSGPAPSFRDVSRDVIHADFFPFSAWGWLLHSRPTFGVLTKEVFKDPTICKTVVDQFPTPGEMVRVESLSDDQLTAKMSVLHCMMMSHGGKLLARYRGLNLNSSHVYGLISGNSRLKGYEDKGEKVSSYLTKSLGQILHYVVARLSAALNQATVLEAENDEEILRLRATLPEFSSFFRSQFQGLVRKFLASDEFSRVQGELISLAASAGFERGLSMHQTKDEFAAVLKKMANFMPSAQDRLESTVTPASKSLELSTNADLTPSVVASEHNEEIVNVEVDVSDPKMTNETIIAKSGHAFVQGISVALRMLWGWWR